MRLKKLTKLFLLLIVLAVFTGCAPRSNGADTSSLVSKSLDTPTYGSGITGGVIMIIIVIVVIILIWSYRNKTGFSVSTNVSLSATVLVVMLIFAFLIAGYTTIDEGEVGVLIRQGDAVKLLNPGGHLITPFYEKVVKFSTRQWTYVTQSNPDSQGTAEYRDFPVSFITPDGVNASIKYTIQGRLDRSQAIFVYERFGTLQDAISQSVKEISRVIVRESLQDYEVEELITRIDEVSDEIETDIRASMEDAGLEFKSFGFRKPSLGLDTNGNGVGDYEEELNNRQVAVQQGLVAEEQIAITRAEAEKQVATAEGQKQVTILNAQADAESARVAADAEAYQKITIAEAEAQANILIAQSITTELINLYRVQQWDGEYPTTYYDMNANPLFTIPVGPPQ